MLSSSVSVLIMLSISLGMPVAGSKEHPPQPTKCGSQQCQDTSLEIFYEMAALRNDPQASRCMNSGVDWAYNNVSHTCKLKQVYGSNPPCGTECYSILTPKLLYVQEICLKEKYPGLEKYNKCLLQHGCDKPGEFCHDTDYGVTDSYGDSCYRYRYGNAKWCGHYDTHHFYSHGMCCVCGGGSCAYPVQSAAEVMKAQGATDVMEDYLSGIYLPFNKTAPEPPIPMTHAKHETLTALESPIAMTHAKHETLSLTLAFTGGALTAIMLGIIAMRLKGSRSSAAEQLLACD